MPEWIYVIRAAREGFKTEPTEAELALMAAHFDYLKSLHADGSVVLAGRTDGAEFGLIVFEAEDEDAARGVMNADPSVANGVMDATLYPYRVALLRGHDG